MRAWFAIGSTTLKVAESKAVLRRILGSATVDLSCVLKADRAMVALGRNPVELELSENSVPLATCVRALLVELAKRTLTQEI